MNKRGQNTTIMTITALVLAVAVIVVLTVFGVGPFQQFKNFLSKDNYNSISAVCSQACSTNDVNAFCVSQRSLVIDKEKKIVSGTTLVTKTDAKAADPTCVQLSQLGASTRDLYGFEPCAAITCP